jgi:signal transduction histidine kinase
MQERARRREDLARAYLVEEVRSALRHGLRNRLSVVRSAAYYLRRKVEGATNLMDSDPNVKRFFELIDREVSTACELLGTAEAEDGRLAAPVDPAEATRVALLLVEPGPAISVALPGGGVPLVATDRDDLELALACLLENAVDAVGARGSGQVRVDARPEPDGRVAIAVIDEGGGLAPDVQDRMLEPFFTTKPGHQGLGLSIARRIASRWGGTLEVASVPGGVQATLRLPAAAATG